MNAARRASSRASAMSTTSEHATFDREIASLSSAALLGATPSRRPFVYWVVGLFAAFVAAMFLPGSRTSRPVASSPR